jgi:hypothetical protein
LSGNEIPGFRIFEKPPAKSYDVKAHLGVHVSSIRDQEKVYGPVFTARLIVNALNFVAQRIDERPPSDVRTLDQLGQYLISKLDKYSTPQCAMMYAQYKTEDELQGQVGAGRRISDAEFLRKTDMKGKDEGAKRIDIDNSILQFRQVAIAMKMYPEGIGYRKNEDGSFDLFLPNCYYKDGCKQAYNEGLLHRPGGRWICNLGFSVCVFLRVSTGYEWESDCMEYDKPHCIVRHHIL